jgi:hypothetical protein
MTLLTGEQNSVSALPVAASEKPTMAIRLLTFIVLFCGALALVELWVPLFASTDRRGRAPANVGLTAITFLLNWALDSSAAILALAL